MRIAIYEHTSPHVLEYLMQFAMGLMRHGERFEFVPIHGKHPIDCDLAVFWGHKRHEIISYQKAHGRRYLVLERGYIGDRSQWISAGFDGLNGRADFCNSDVTFDRFLNYFDGRLKPWKNNGDYLLVIGQCRHDEAVRGIDIVRTLQETVNNFKERSELPIRFRPHPEDPGMPAPRGSLLLNSTLEESLNGAQVVLTINSNVGVDATLAGIPVVALDRGSMVWAVSGHSVDDLLSPLRPLRERWAAELAWCQWTQQEITHGEAWSHLRNGYKILS